MENRVAKRARDDSEQNAADASPQDVKRAKASSDTGDSTNPNFIVLNVSGRKFHTLKATLLSSPYFSSLLERWDDSNINSNRMADGSYFIDADPNIFQYILNFMRRGSTFPFFWDKDNGFDLSLYNSLACEADYFGLDDLHHWIRAGKYKEAVQTEIRLHVTRIWSEEHPEIVPLVTGSHSNMDVLHTAVVETEDQRSRHFCPRHGDHLTSYDCHEDEDVRCWDKSFQQSSYQQTSKTSMVNLVRETIVDMGAFVNREEEV